MKLFGYWRSSSTWRVRIALELKNVSYEYVPVNLIKGGGEQHRRGFTELSPLAQVPCLEIAEGPNQLVLSQSMAIIEYLEERLPEPPLLPGDAVLRARAREFAQIVNSGIQPFHNLGFQAELKKRVPRLDALAFSRRFIEKGLRALELLALPLAGSYSLGETPTLADVYLVPQLYQARRHEVDLNPFPTLQRVEQSCSQIPAFTRAHPDQQPDAAPALPSEPGKR